MAAILSFRPASHVRRPTSPFLSCIGTCVLAGAACGAPGAQQTNATSNSPAQTQDHAEFPLAIAVGEHGWIAEWDGRTWTHLNWGADVELDAVTYATPTRALVVGEDGIILQRTTQGWSQMASPTTFSLFGVTAVAGGGAVAVGRGGTAVTLVNGEWQHEPVPVPSSVLFADVAADTAGTYALAVGRDDAVDSEDPSGVVLSRGADGWKVLSQNTVRELHTVAVVSTHSAFLGGYADFLAGDPLALYEWNGTSTTRVPDFPWRRTVSSISKREAMDGSTSILAVTDGGGTPDSLGGGLVLRRRGQWEMLGDMQNLIGHPAALYAACLLFNGEALAVGPAADGGLVVMSHQGAWTAATLPTSTLHGVACAP